MTNESGKLVSAAEFAEHIGISERHVRRLVPILKQVERGKFDLKTSINGYCESLREQIRFSASADLLRERTRLTKINADRKTLLLKKERGELISTEKAMYAWGLITKNIDNKLSSLPRKSAPLLYGLAIAEIEAKQKELIDEVRDEISNPNLRELTGMARRKNSRAVTEKKATVKRKTVGRQKKDQKGRTW